jgi:hypothetical protein
MVSRSIPTRRNRAGYPRLGSMAKIEKKALLAPDGKRSFDKGHVELVTLAELRLDVRLCSPDGAGPHV